MIKPFRFILCLICLAGVVCGQNAPGLSAVSGNGQIVVEQFPANAPFVAEARDQNGNPIPNLPITWSISFGSGTLRPASTVTDANGRASANFLATSLPGGYSISQATITASTSVGSANFYITTALSRQPGGALAAPPLAVLATPPPENRTITARSGTTVPGAVVVNVAVQTGIQSGQPVPNVGIRIVNPYDLTATPAAHCSAPFGVALTDQTGTATCDLVVTGGPGLVALAAEVGEVQITPAFSLQITAGTACSFTLSNTAQSFAGAGGNGTVSVNTQQGCGWTASSNVNWISISSGASGLGNGPVNFSVAANPGAARTGSLSIAGQLVTISQSAAGTTGGSGVTIITGATLPSASVGVGYSTALNASGGRAPYTWSISGSLPPGISLSSPIGIISGTPLAAGTYSFIAAVTDGSGTNVSQSFTLTVVSAGGASPLSISNTSFPAAVTGQEYMQTLTAAGACVSPFAPTPTFSLAAGSLPNGLSIQQRSGIYMIGGTPANAGTFNFTLSVSDSCGRTATANYTITVTGGGQVLPTMTVSPSSLAFIVQNGAKPADQSISIAATGGAVPYSASALSLGNWLEITAGSTGKTPASLSLGVTNQTSLTPGNYTGTVTIVSTAGNSPVTVLVSLTVTAPPSITVSPNSLDFRQASGSRSQQPVAIFSAFGTAKFSAAVSTALGGSWLTVSPGTGDAPGSINVGVNAAGLPAGLYSGTVTVTPVGGAGLPQIVQINLAVTVPPALTAAASSLSFSAQAGAAGRVSQVLSLGSTSDPVTFSTNVSTTSGGAWLGVSLSNSTTPASLTVSADPSGLAPGFYAGTVTIAPVDSSSVPINILVAFTVTQAGGIITAVTNAASFASGPVAPGEVVTIFGSNLSSPALTGLRLTATGAIDTQIAETRVLFDDIPAPLIYVSANQISAVVPYEIEGRAGTRVQVEYKGAKSNAMVLRVIDSAPGIFTVNASGQGAILNQDGTVNSTDNGAAPGSVVSIYATGEGQTDPSGVTGLITSDVLARPKLPVTVQMGDDNADILYAGSAPGLPAGVMQVNVRVPAAASRGTALPIVIRVGDRASQPGVTMAIKP